ncbi:MAG: type II toxin-antitoxin system HicA family toxin [Azoarcus sp.]|nr:type II toxin-antitoxin system HicA family toxin [Azoarcus sp.]
MNAKRILKILKANGWEVLRQEGSHIRLGKGVSRTTVPMHGARGMCQLACSCRSSGKRVSSSGKGEGHGNSVSRKNHATGRWNVFRPVR